MPPCLTSISPQSASLDGLPGRSGAVKPTDQLPAENLRRAAERPPGAIDFRVHTIYVTPQAQMAELVDALLSGSSAHKAWRFESSSGHHHNLAIIARSVVLLTA
ncbi:hypothetical protein HYPGJ_32061 [Hyphomicrobium sp. GJ21]|nr:hypothetical protein HYPGJ_32061 [Hyphomicrobium sp. GJ21]